MANPAAETQFRLVVNPKARLFDQIREFMRFHHSAIRTEKASTQLIQRFLVFHRQKDRTGPVRGCPSRSAFADRSVSRTFQSAIAGVAAAGGTPALRTQDLLGNKDVATTQIYTHVMQKPDLGVRSPLDQ